VVTAVIVVGSMLTVLTSCEMVCLRMHLPSLFARGRTRAI